MRFRSIEIESRYFRPITGMLSVRVRSTEATYRLEKLDLLAVVSQFISSVYKAETFFLVASVTILFA